LDIQTWLNEFKTQKTLKDEFFIYILDDNEIKVYKTKYKKNKEIAKGIKLSYSSASGYKYNDITTKEDKEILELLQLHINSGDILGVIFKKLCKTGRFFTPDLEPIKCDKKVLELRFENNRLVTNITGELFDSDPIIEYDKPNLYFLDTNMKYDEIEKLLDSPEFKKEDEIEVFRLFNKKNIKIDPPSHYQIEVLETSPKAVLTLQANKYIQLAFLYDKYEIKPYPFEEVSVKETKSGEIKIIRDNNYEKSVIDEIIKYGFRDLENSFVAKSIESWKNFLDDIEVLKKKYIINFVDFDLEFNDYSEIMVESEDEQQWFSLSFEVKIGRKKYPLLPIIVPILKEVKSLDELPEEMTLPYENNKYITLKTKEIKPILSTIFELIDKVKDNSLKIAPFEAHMIDFDEDVKWKGKKELLKLSKQLKNFEGIKEVTPPKGLTITLRDYQKFGLNWLMFLRDFRFGGILADDMGLGKTIQTLSLLLRLKEGRKLKKPALIIVPTSLLGNWKAEIEKFTPDLKYISVYGSDRGAKFREILKYDVVFTTYNLIVKDFEIYQKHQFEYIILDEAQKIKNPNTKSTQLIKQLNSNYKLALSGTPIENHLGELWSIFSFVMPGFLGSLKTFKQAFQNPIEKEKNEEVRKKLNKKVSPFILRRTKEKVLNELPDKVEIVKYAEFSEEEVKLYESIRVIMDKKVRDAIAQNGLNRSQILVLDALLKLRQVCCHPSLVKIDEAKKIKTSSKLEMFLELVDELIAEGRKILVFSQFTSMISIIEEELAKRDIKYSTLTGKTKNRDEVIEEFKTKSDIFLISLKAGGVGLNLTEADTVIHYDPWWNVAAQNQATDRAYRIGQDKNVFVYKLVVRNSIEEKILDLQKRKASLTSIYEEDTKIEPKELLELLK